MKLRIQDASIRLRLTQGEVARFARQGRIEASTPFGTGGSLTYRLQTSADAQYLSARFDGRRIVVSVPSDAARRWTETDEVGIDAPRHSEDETLEILVEKDFQCLHKDEPERNADAYPHPLERRATPPAASSSLRQ